MAEGHVQVGLDFVAEDHASGTLHKLMEGAEKLNEKFEHVTESLVELLGVGAALGGVFSFAKMVEGTEERITAVDKLSRQTGIATEETDGLLEAMNRFGISSEEATGIVGRLSKQMLKTSEAAGMGNLKQSAQSMRRLGVDINQGVVPSLIAMAKQTEKGKLNVSAIQVGLRTSADSALKLNKFFGQGAKQLKETIEEVKESGLAVRKQDVAMLDRFKVAKNDVTAAVERIGLVFGREVLPVMTTLMEQLATKMKEWAPAVKEFGHWLGEHLRTGIQLATTLGKILLANYALQKVGAGGIGGVLKTVGSPIVSAVKSASSAVGVVGSGALGMSGETIAAAASLAASTAVLSVAAGVLATIGLGVRAILEDYKGVDEFLMEGINNLRDSFSGLFDALGIGDGGVGDDVIDFFKLLLPHILRTLIDFVSLFVDGLVGLGKVLGAVASDLVSGHWGSIGHDVIGALDEVNAAKDAAKKRREDEAEKERAASARENAESKAPVHNQNFYGAKFDVTQTFAEGFEPDRILTAFTHDLAGLGTRGGQSNFGPLGTTGGQG